MASASASFKIGGKYDGKAISNAKKDLKSLGDTVKSISTIMKGLAVVKVVKELNNIANATKGVYIEQNKALTSFNLAVKKSGIEIQKINTLKKELSNGNFIDDDTINNAIKFGIQMGLNEEQLDKVTRTAINMNASGVMPLDKALKQLTNTALKNGDELDKVAAQYDGFASAMANTFDGRNTQWTNSVSDLKAAIGSIPTALQFLAQGKLLEPLNKITDWIVDNRDYILNFFIHLPEVFTTVMQSIGQMLKKTFENLPELISEIAPLMVQLAKDSFSTFFEVGKAAIKGIADLLDFAIGNPFRTSKDFINKMLNNLIEGINGLVDKLPDGIKKFLGIDDGLITYRFSTNNNEDNKTWDSTAKGISESIEKASKTFKDGTKKMKEDWLKILDATTEFYGDDVEDLKVKLSAILGQDLPEDLQNALNGITWNGNGVTPSSQAGEEIKTPIKDAIFGATGEIGQLLKLFFDKDATWKDWIVLLITKVSDVIVSASEIISKALNSVTFLLNQVLPPIIKVLENWLSPIVVFITQIGAILRDFFRLFEPFFSAVGGNVIKLLLISVITVLDFIYNVIVAIQHLVAKKENEWAYRDIGADINAINDSKSNFDSTTALSLTTSNASASVNGARDIYVNIIYNNSYVNGDARQIALNIRDEIRTAEQMGY